MRFGFFKIMGLFEPCSCRRYCVGEFWVYLCVCVCAIFSSPRRSASPRRSRSRRSSRSDSSKSKSKSKSKSRSGSRKYVLPCYPSCQLFSLFASLLIESDFFSGFPTCQNTSILLAGWDSPYHTSSVCELHVGSHCSAFQSSEDTQLIVTTGIGCLKLLLDIYRASCLRKSTATTVYKDLRTCVNLENDCDNFGLHGKVQ